MRIYDILADNNRDIITLVAELDTISFTNQLERNTVFERLKGHFLESAEIKSRTFYAELEKYPPAHKTIDYLRHTQLQLAGMLDALTRESLSSPTWNVLFASFKLRLEAVISYEEQKAIPLAKSYFTPEDQEWIMQQIQTEEHFLERNRFIEAKAEKALGSAYLEEKKALDTPGKSHLPPKRWRM